MTYYLYVKTHNQTGLKYLGQTSADPYTYKGSGTRWTNHLKKHGADISTEILIITDSKDVIKEKDIEYSNRFNIVESNEWANLKIEEGDGGWSTWNKAPAAQAARLKGAKKGGGLRSTSFKKGDPEVVNLSKKLTNLKKGRLETTLMSIRNHTKKFLNIKKKIIV